MIRLFQDTTSVGNTDTTEADLHTFTLPAGRLATTGDAIRIRTWVQNAANTNNKATKVYFGSTAVVDTTGQTYNNVAFIVDAWVFRTGAATQKAIGSGLQPNINAAWSIAAGGGSNITAPSETLSGTVSIRVTGVSSVQGTANDVVALATVIDYFPAA